MINRAALLADLRKQVAELEDDLRTCAADDERVDAALRREWERARTAERIAATFESWRDERVTQAAVAWVLGTVFLRYCEDNRLMELPYLAGPGDRLDVAQERQGDFFRAHPEKTDRDWILAGFRAMSVSPVVAGLFDFRHNAMWLIARPAEQDESTLSFDAQWDAAAARLAGPSHPVAQKLLGFWRTTDANRQIVHDFAGEDTRFLGDLYQDLSEHAKKTYALLQTPDFVEEFILDYTLTPALEEFREEFRNQEFRLIDPACGSGHFLLGAFKRILTHWELEAPGADRWDVIARTLKSVHGVDKNPFAAEIARFRLLIAALEAGSVKSLEKAPEFPINVAVADTLRFRRAKTQGQASLTDVDAMLFATEDVWKYVEQCDILAPQSYHVVVGNPPYITVKDQAENRGYRDLYETCTGKYALSVPFAERFFDLATSGHGSHHNAGFVGQITANSFMKREFGKKLIEDFLTTKVDLKYIIDTSGVHIPGHGIPTAILIGRNNRSNGGSIRTVMGIRGEPTQPITPAEGHVWRAIVNQIQYQQSESEWITVATLGRNSFAKHPWTLSGGGAKELAEFIVQNSAQTLDSVSASIGSALITGEDDAYVMPRTGLPNRLQTYPWTPFIGGDQVRDWTANTNLCSIRLLDAPDAIRNEIENHLLWPVREFLRRTLYFGETKEERGLRWSDFVFSSSSRLKAEALIGYAEVATHNHFYLSRHQALINKTAPVIVLPSKTTDAAHLELITVLNSSIACFWLKQVCHDKGSGGIGGGIASEDWEKFHQYSSTKVAKFPLPAVMPLEFGRELDRLTRRLSEVEPSAVCADGVPTRARLEEAQAEYYEIRGRMVALQEELDWEVYKLYGLLNEDEAVELCAENRGAGPDDPGVIPGLNLGERAFEIVLARKMAAGEIETQWFARHGSTPITELPAHWPAAYRKVVERRIEIVEARRDLALIERPECKRRWASEPWDKKEREALTTWLLDRCEARDLWYVPDDLGKPQPRPMTVNRLADKLRADADVVSVARLLKGPDADLADVLTVILADEHVPYLAALRYKDTGLRKRAQWERTWDLQREEDATGERLNIPVPPKYTSADFRRPSFWKHRGKLDVPKERFISYPGAGPEADDSLLLGWAGWDHRDQGYTLMTLIEERANHDLWDGELLTPLIAGLREVLPWIRQWHAVIDPDYGDSWANALSGYFEAQQHRYGLTDDDLTSWGPKATGRGRKKA
ncbi:BREX-2 system adenine-specific DNA-methyltransferase PglX [Microbispora cellulosiformans]|uniref:site-specific DNA-methyltransferase (adenine-specific) n=1 Tax=Microbispora cellulosiformans TaxID=2614688 RepID=A0A5J5K8Y0_9ACTN|nr:BREX-2 system adenine-specific DNA-methyltransferase PglX [Microbispora cellulosiformans]KAA9380114.1 BREX-2 system adenine-specific DNA-methyltransferase PglX [Microbispora cellulosiformans]